MRARAHTNKKIHVKQFATITLITILTAMLTVSVTASAETEVDKPASSLIEAPKTVTSKTIRSKPSLLKKQSADQDKTEQNEWKLQMTVYSRGSISERRPVHIYTRKIKGKQLKEFKGVTTVDANANSILALIIDVPHIPKLFYNGKMAKSIIGPDGKPYLYTQILGRWPVAARDSVVSAKMTQDPVTKEIIINASSVDGVYPEQKDHVRIRALKSSWKILPLKNGHSRVTFIGHADPAGYIPTWLANLVVTDMPRVSLRNVHSHVNHTKYQKMKMHELKTGIENFNPLALDLPEVHKN